MGLNTYKAEPIKVNKANLIGLETGKLNGLANNVSIINVGN